MIDATINMLGLKGRDRVTGFRGTITSVCFDLYGCVQMSLSPDAKEGDDDLKHGHWFDVSRVVVADEERAMPVPDFRAMATLPADFGHGPAEKGPPRL